MAVPFTPATGSRLLLHPQVENQKQISVQLIQTLLDQAQKYQLSSLHVLFLLDQERKLWEAHGFKPRLSYQFHWLNKNYQSFDDYLQDLHRKRRQQVRKERRDLAALNLEIQTLTGDEIQPQHMEAIKSFYQNTMQEKGSIPYLKPAFFDQLQQTFRHRLLLVLAKKDGEYVGGTFNLFKNEFLYGRYWGCTEFIPNLHFECCFYRLIEFAIENKIQKVEAGAQGEQKFLRGFGTVPTYSMHWIHDERMRGMINEFLEKEWEYVEETIDGYNQVSPLRYLRKN